MDIVKKNKEKVGRKEDGPYHLKSQRCSESPISGMEDPNVKEGGQ